jgi:hypothetical protein
MATMRHLMRLVEGIKMDPRFQYHLSVEPDLVPGKPFSEQTRTISHAGARGDASGEDAGYIYTTLNLRHWATQFFYEEVEDFPAFVYLVFVKDGSGGSIWAAHQDASPPQDVIVLAKLGEIDLEGDDVPDYGLFEWNAQKWIKQNGAAFLQLLGENPSPDVKG